MDQDRDTVWISLGETQPLAVIADIVRGQRSWADAPSDPATQSESTTS
jgi:hypothetical protein